ncbi:MAG: ATP-binding protein [Myxococcota bacterium]|nr:ATP-binding protein [Myxococcota bacterium]
MAFPDQPEKYSFRVPARTSMRPAVSAFLSVICRELESARVFTTQMTHQAVSAFTEGYNNVVEHAYSESANKGDISVEIIVNHDFLEIVLSDSGRTFDIENVPQPDLDALPEGGMGIFIMKQFMDSVTYSHREGYNQLRMRKAYTKEKVADAQNQIGGS